MQEQLLITQKEDLGKLLLRFSIGFLMLFHGIAKATGGINFVKQLFTNSNIPEIFAYGVYLGEIIAPILIIIGLKTRLSALLVAVTMVGAILLVHSQDIFTLNKYGAWAIELPAFYLFTSIVLFFLGAGKYSVDYKSRK